MRLCLTCYTLSPRGSIFCGSCGRSFGGRVCTRRHLSPRNADFCTSCGSRELTEPTAYIGLGWLSLVLALGVGSLLFKGLAYELGVLTQTPAAHVLFARIITGIILVGFVLALWPGANGRTLRRTAGRAASRFCRALWRLVALGFVWRLARDWIRETQRQSERKASKRLP